MQIIRTNPLDQIEFWITSQSLHVQEELTSIICKYTHDELIKDGSLSTVLTYLDSSGLPDLEIVTRTLFITRLIDFSFANRATEKDWMEMLERQLVFKTKMTAEGESTHRVDEWISDFEYNKRVWTKLYHDWVVFITQELSDANIADWLTDPYAKRSVH